MKIALKAGNEMETNLDTNPDSKLRQMKINSKNYA